jgi:hypothetical protein
MDSCPNGGGLYFHSISLGVAQDVKVSSQSSYSEIQETKHGFKNGWGNETEGGERYNSLGELGASCEGSRVRSII